MNCYNGEKYLREAIDSVTNQTYKNWEIIFWDNKSTDKSAKIFKGYKDKRPKYYFASTYANIIDNSS
jgi:glycosyltransferase involved in cell wall biosynthesis